MHQPVLLQEVIQYLNPQKGDFIIDGTIDGGGHAAAILKRVMPNGTLLGVDWDKSMIGLAEEKIAKSLTPKAESVKIILEEGNYADLPEILKKNNLPKADGLLLDLGFSSKQLESGKGFSFSKDEPLVMTYGDNRKPAAQILKDLKERELADVIFRFSGEKYSRRIAKAIKERLKEKQILTSGELREVVAGALPRNYERGRIDPATRTFQALRIYANDELGNLERVLKNLQAILKPGGRAAIMSFHSLEDRIVKNAFREYARIGIAEVLTKKPVVPSEEEIKNNPRARSAKLRAAELAKDR